MTSTETLISQPIRLTPTEAAAVLAYRADVLLADISDCTGLRPQYVEAAIVAAGRRDTADLLVMALAR